MPFSYKKNVTRNGSSFHHIHKLLPQMFDQICRHYEDRPDLVLTAWKEVIGPTFSSQTEAISLVDGVLTVKVKNSTLYSLLCQHERLRLLQNLKQKFPKQNIKNLQFRLT